MIMLYISCPIVQCLGEPLVYMWDNRHSTITIIIDTVQFSNITSQRTHNICTMLDQRRRRRGDVVQMLYKCFVFAGFLRCVIYLPISYFI